MKVKEENEKVDLKLNIQKTTITASSLITSWQIDGRQWKQWQTFFWGGEAPKPAFSYGFPGGSEATASTCNAGDPGLIPGLWRSPGEGKDNPLQYSCLENPMDRGAWQATVHRVAKSQTRLSDFIHTHTHKPADGHCSHQSKRCLLLGRKVMTNLDSVLKSRDITCQQRSV